MDQYDLLIHVSAPARVQDDNRYLSLAQSIIDFKAAAVTFITASPDLSGTSDDAGYAEPSHSSSFSIPSSPSQQQNTLRGAEGGRSDRAALPTNWPRTKPGSNLPAPKRQTFNYNPPYKNPFHVTHTATRSRDPRTPNQHSRPRPAPEDLGRTVQVPFTGLVKRRANSQTASFGSLSSQIPDSQPTSIDRISASQPASRAAAGTSFTEETVAGERSLIRSLSQASLDEEPPTKRKRTMKSEDKDDGRVWHDRPTCTEAFFLQDRSLDWTSSPSCSAKSQTDSAPSTASLSQPLCAPAQYSDHAYPSASQIAASHPVDLTFSSSSRDAATSSSPRVSQRTTPRSGCNSNKPADMCAVFAPDLPRQVTSAEPTPGQVRFSTHITAWLEDFAVKLPLGRFFRPIEVRRDVRVLERGWWSMEVRIADAEVVKTARQSPTKEQRTQAFRDRLTGATSEERLKKYEQLKQAGDIHDYDYGFEDKAQGLLTEAEFFHLWGNVSSFIEAGKAGWGIKMVWQDQEHELSHGEVARLHIRIFTWGEIIGHVYLALWVLSDKVTARIPMEWIAGDGSTIVRMAGTRAGRGKLGTWTRKGAEGEQGCWGVAED